MCLCAHPLYQGSLLSVHDIDCTAPASPRGAEEFAGSHHLVFVRSGVFVKHVGSRQIVGDPSRVMFFNRGDTYRVSHPVDGGDTCTMITCSAATWAELLSRHDEAVRDREAPFTQTHAPAPMHGVARVQRLRRMLREGVSEPIAVEEAATRVIDAVFANGRRTGAKARRSATRAARRELTEHTALLLSSKPEARHSLSGLAKTVNASPFHLARVFRDETGGSIHQHLLKLRLALALDRVLDRTDHLSTIAHSLGFSSHAHFTTAFQRAFGQPPSAIRAGRWRAS
jgi:AraC family transcriptional regulator